MFVSKHHPSNTSNDDHIIDVKDVKVKTKRHVKKK